MSSINPFTIAVPDKKLEELHQKLQNASFPDELDEAGWDMGVPLTDMKRLITTWRETFDWRAQEKKLNEQLNQFTVPVSVDRFGELNIHVLHHRSGKPSAIPLLFIHGCKVSFERKEGGILADLFIRAWQLPRSYQVDSIACEEQGGPGI